MERGFRQVYQQLGTRYQNVPGPEGKAGKVYEGGVKIVNVQGLPGKWLDPSRDYLLMFRFKKLRPAEFRIAMNFVAPGVCTETNLESLEKALGLIVNTNQLEAPNPAGATNK